MVKLTENVIDLLSQPNPCFIATTMADGSPQVTLTWVDTDGQHVLINTVQTHLKVRNIRRDPRVAVAVTDRANSFRYAQIRGRVLEIKTEGAAEHIEALSQRYTGGPYSWYGGRDQVRVILVIEPERVSGIG